MTSKRVLDIVGGSVLAAVALPAILLLAIGCAVSLRSWPFFVQRRVGKDGREFRLPKLRTLPRSTPKNADKYQISGTPIPRFCRLLRRLHIDELPQLLVVPLGRMSLVGPRPEMPGLLSRYPSDFAALRSRVRPGCTGLWQVSTASGLLIYEAPEYDIEYVHNAGWRLDTWVLFQTVRMWVRGTGSVELDDVPAWALPRGRVTAREPVTEIDLRVDATGTATWRPATIDLTALHHAEEVAAEQAEVPAVLPVAFDVPD
jgi:lipopolysaccharide/colanic/teichoic acid biosynthesis glycosyltransferase